MGWHPFRAGRDRELARVEGLRCAQRFLREELAAFDEQLDRLQAEVSSTEDGAVLADYERARSAYDAVRTAAQSAQTGPALVALEPQLHEGRYHLACAVARRDGLAVPSRRDPCYFNPQHGPATTDVLWTAPGEEQKRVAACQSDATKLAEGAQPDVRLVRVGDRWVPWYAADGSIAGLAQRPSGVVGGRTSRTDKHVDTGRMASDLSKAGWIRR